MLSFAVLPLLAVAVSAANLRRDDSDDNGGAAVLDSNLLCTGCEQTGIGANGSETGEVASITSKENFINFCGGQDGGPSDKPITNGIQITTGSCNPVPMGTIAATTNMPACKFIQPKNLDTIPSNTNFTVQMAIQHLTTGNFVNSDTNYFGGPQFLDSNGDIVGHSHIVIQAIDSLQSTSIADPTQFAFFQGLDTAAENGVLSVDVTGGLPAGTYKMSSINSAANHQPVLVAVAKHGHLDDAIYFTVADGGDDNGGDDGQDDGNNDQVQQQQGGFDGHHRQVKRAASPKRMARLSKRRLDLERSA